MPRRGFGKRKGGYKGPIPGPEKGDDAEGERAAATQKPAKKPPLTHFLCVPLVTAESRPQLQASLQRFKEALPHPGEADELVATQEHRVEAEVGDDVSVEEQERDVPAPATIPVKAIRPVGTLHLTLGVMSLQSPEKVDEAVSLLQSLDLAALLRESLAEPPTTASANENAPASDEVQPSSNPQAQSSIPSQPESVVSEPKTNASDASISGGQPPGSGVSKPLVISLTSLVSMHPPRKTSILYAHPEDLTGRLHVFCNNLKNLFTKRGLMVEETRPLKLHATIVNTIYAKAGGRQGKGHGPNARAPIRIDATSLLQEHADFVWADAIRVGKVAICKMGAKKILDAQGRVEGEEYEQIAFAEING